MGQWEAEPFFYFLSFHLLHFLTFRLFIFKSFFFSTFRLITNCCWLHLKGEDWLGGRPKTLPRCCPPQPLATTTMVLPPAPQCCWASTPGPAPPSWPQPLPITYPPLPILPPNCLASFCQRKEMIFLGACN